MTVKMVCERNCFLHQDIDEIRKEIAVYPM